MKGTFPRMFLRIVPCNMLFFRALHTAPGRADLERDPCESNPATLPTHLGYSG